ncbi:CoA-binding protein [Eubacterium multiforme]|uniref:CoA-binding protein n=1 Tax=Eubacterium multiforme TaxID=83339 RepID=A0ABT9UUH2_9FIRM|nr:CoA-binding protein [Eubacterium multiforme]MDQ0149960.1 putative CoA-binding protein [Eubacterium multiforme]
MSIKDMISCKNWVVIGDVTNKDKYAYKILQKFKLKGCLVSGVSLKKLDGVYNSLKDVPYKIDAIDLCINPIVGFDFIKEANELNIKNILIQPGAESDEILDYCKENNINAVQGCALVQL